MKEEFSKFIFEDTNMNKIRVFFNFLLDITVHVFYSSINFANFSLLIRWDADYV